MRVDKGFLNATRHFASSPLFSAGWQLARARKIAASLAKLNAQGKIDLSRAVADSVSFRAVFGGLTQDRTRQTAPNVAASTT